MTIDNWIPVLHVVGAVAWVGGLVAVLALLSAAPGSGAREAVVRLGRRLALVADLGATLAIAMGLWRALKVVPTEFANGGWLHVKLTAVVVCILSVHGLARARLARLRRGEAATVPAWAWAVLAVGVIAAITLGSNKLLMRG